jgi:hypothetical protein
MLVVVRVQVVALEVVVTARVCISSCCLYPLGHCPCSPSQFHLHHAPTVFCSRLEGGCFLADMIGRIRLYSFLNFLFLIWEHCFHSLQKNLFPAQEVCYQPRSLE